MVKSNSLFWAPEGVKKVVISHLKQYQLTLKICVRQKIALKALYSQNQMFDMTQGTKIPLVRSLLRVKSLGRIT